MKGASRTHAHHHQFPALRLLRPQLRQQVPWFRLVQLQSPRVLVRALFLLALLHNLLLRILVPADLRRRRRLLSPRMDQPSRTPRGATLPHPLPSARHLLPLVPRPNTTSSKSAPSPQPSKPWRTSNWTAAAVCANRPSDIQLRALNSSQRRRRPPPPRPRPPPPPHLKPCSNNLLLLQAHPQYPNRLRTSCPDLPPARDLALVRAILLMCEPSCRRFVLPVTPRRNTTTSTRSVREHREACSLRMRITPIDASPSSR